MHEQETARVDGHVLFCFSKSCRGVLFLFSNMEAVIVEG